MPKQQAATVPAATNAPKPRQLDRVRRPTERFVKGWFSESLPRLSLALGIGATDGQEAGRAGTEGEALSSDGNEPLAVGSRVEDEARIPRVREKDQEAAIVGASANRRSERERKATDRFVEGWFGEHLPRLSSALGVAVAGRQKS